MLTSLTLVRYKSRYIPFAFLSMAIHRLPLSFNSSCSFWKLMGSGKNGTFDLNPDFNQWALLAVWKDRGSFENFHSNSFISKWWKKLTTERYTILCEPLSSHGKWDGINPFQQLSPEATTYTGPVAVLTRATIRFSKLKYFWKNVAKVAAIMNSAKGYIASYGIGEAPVYRQATFSLWESVEDVKSFAYKGAEHRDVIQKTREQDWYSEELFARFKPVATFGTLNGTDPLANRL